MGSLLGSKRCGMVSQLTGLSSVRTASGVCAPIPHAFVTDGASFLTGKESLLTASEIVCATGITCQPSGGTVFTTGLLPTEHQIGSRSSNVWIEIPIGNVPNCASGFVTHVTVDVIDLLNTDDGVFTVYIAHSGAVNPTAFASNGINTALCSTHVTTSYATYNLVSVGGASPPDWNRNDAVLNANPLSFYIWPPVTGPSFVGSTQKFKNFTGKITAV